MTIDAAASGALMNKPYPEASALIEDMAQNHQSWGVERATVEKKEAQGGVHELISIDMMQAKMDVLALKIEHICINPNTAAAVSSDYEICGTKGHQSAECSLLNETHSEQVNYTQGNPYSNTYNPGWRNHPNFSYKKNNPIQNNDIPRPSYQAPRSNQPMQPVPPKRALRKFWKILSQLKPNKIKSS
jgi:hypothetical protein